MHGKACDRIWGPPHDRLWVGRVVGPRDVDIAVGVDLPLGYCVSAPGKIERYIDNTSNLCLRKTSSQRLG
jgi:hypothetical protein